MTSTSSCLQKKIDSLKQQIDVAKINVSTCLSKDASNEILLEKNLQLTAKLQQYQQNVDEEYQSQSTLSSSTTVPIVSITIIYIILFFILGIFYNVLLSKAIITIMNNQDYVNDINNLSNISYQDKWKNINYCLNKYRFALFFLILIITFTINFGIMYSLILKGTQNIKAIKVIIICILAIIGVTFLLINNVHFNKIFENTIGYYLIQFISPKKDISFTTFINSLFTHNIFPKNGIDFSFILTMFRLDNYGDIIKAIGIKSNEKYDFYFNSLNIENMNILTNMIVTKNTIGHMSWILFSTIACTFVSLKYLIKNL